MVKLVRVSLAHNQLHDVTAMTSLSECEVADWSNNLLEHLPGDIEGMKSLVTLDVSHNEVTKSFLHPITDWL